MVIGRSEPNHNTYPQRPQRNTEKHKKKAKAIMMSDVVKTKSVMVKTNGVEVKSTLCKRFEKAVFQN